MTLKLTGRKTQITDEIREYIELKIPRVEKLLDKASNIDVIITKDRYEFRASMTVKAGAKSVLAETRDSKVLNAIDALVDKIEAQLRKKSGKALVDAKHKQSAASKRAVAVGEPIPVSPKSTRGSSSRNGSGKSKFSPTIVATDDDAKHDVLVFHKGRQVIESMSPEEAAQELFFRDENFLIFNHRSDKSLMVMYRRKDGNFGMLELTKK
jgi:putative sigma-54 modulation protein